MPRQAPSDDSTYLRFAVDVLILRHASGQSGVPARKASCKAALDAMLAEPEAKLLLDREQLIRAWYREKLGAGEGLKWVTDMATRDKVDVVRRARIQKSTVAKLSEAGFRQGHEDCKLYVRTAATVRAHIVTLDPHFTKVARILKKDLEVVVVSPEEVCSLLRRGADDTVAEEVGNLLAGRLPHE